MKKRFSSNFKTISIHKPYLLKCVKLHCTLPIVLTTISKELKIIFQQIQ